jgi:clathrin heavy chain
MSQVPQVPSPQTPLKGQQVLLLTDLGISPQSIKFTNVTAESARFIVVKEDTKVHIVSVANKKATSLPVTVDSAIMNPISNVMGLRAKNNLQIYNLDLKSRMKTTEANENVLFWKWLDGRTIAYVTGTSVFHWSVEGDTVPEKKFEIVAEERQMQIINYDSSKDGNWLFLQGIAKNPDTQKN